MEKIFIDWSLSCYYRRWCDYHYQYVTEKISKQNEWNQEKTEILYEGFEFFSANCFPEIYQLFSVVVLNPCYDIDDGLQNIDTAAAVGTSWSCITNFQTKSWETYSFWSQSNRRRRNWHWKGKDLKKLGVSVKRTGRAGLKRSNPKRHGLVLMEADEHLKDSFNLNFQSTPALKSWSLLHSFVPLVILR